MKPKRYRVEAQARQSDVWEAVYFTDSLDTARRYAAGLLRSEEVRATRVVDQDTGEVVDDDQT